MKQIYKDENLEIVTPENYEEKLSNNNWCTIHEDRYKFHTEKLGQTLIRFIFSDGYLLSLGVNKKMDGQWIDNVKNNNNQSTTMYLNNLNGDVFYTDKMKDIATRYNNENLENMSNRIAGLSDEVKNKILEYLK